MKDADSWRIWRLLLALFVLVQLECVASKVTWELVQPLASSSAQAPGTLDTAAITTAAKLLSHEAPWPASTVEVSSIWLASHASVAVRMHLAVRHTHSARCTHGRNRTSDRLCDGSHSSRNHCRLPFRSAQGMTRDYGCAAYTTSRCGEACCTCTQKVRCLIMHRIQLVVAGCV
jgi:hypothetical protein